MIKFVDFNYGKVPDMSERLDIAGGIAGLVNTSNKQATLLIFYKRDKKK